MEYVIIGNGTAAIACIEGIRTEDKQGEIALISAENRHCYGRPLISYKLLGRISADKMDYRPRDFYENNNVRTYLGREAVKIDAAAKTVVLDGGEKIPYSKLLVATGSRPFIPPVSGLDKIKYHTFMTYDDMEALERELSEDKRVLVVGAGLIGLKCVEGILHRVKSVTVVDVADRVLPSILDPDGARIIRAELEECGVKFILGDSAAEFTDGTAVLKSGARVEFDILVMAVGVRPNVSLIKDCGGDVDHGITVNAKCETSLPDIYAAGDCSEGYDMSVDSKRVLAILPNAYFQGKCAGINMAGGVASFVNAVPMNAIGFFGSHVLSAGSYDGELIVNEVSDSSLRKLYVKDGKLSGFVLINDFARAGVYTSFIRNSTPLSDVDLELLKEKPQLLAFSKEERKKKLARRV